MLHSSPGRPGAAKSSSADAGRFPDRRHVGPVVDAGDLRVLKEGVVPQSEELQKTISGRIASLFFVVPAASLVEEVQMREIAGRRAGVVILILFSNSRQILDGKTPVDQIIASFGQDGFAPGTQCRIRLLASSIVAWRAHRSCQRAAAIDTIKQPTASRLDIVGRRRTHFSPRSRRGVGRAWIGRSQR